MHRRHAAASPTPTVDRTAGTPSKTHDGSPHKDSTVDQGNPMTDTPSHTVRQLAATDIGLMRELLGVFGEVFEQVETYTAAQPDDAYLEALLGGDNFIAVVALDGDTVIGGLAAYVMKKYEQVRSEIHIYDLAVAEAYRRRGIATQLIEHLKTVAAARGVYLIFVQADYIDPPAIALYSTLGVREDVLHFDIKVP